MGNCLPKLKFLRIFQRFRLVKFIEKFKTRVKNLKTEKIIAFDNNLHELPHRKKTSKKRLKYIYFGSTDI